jgi:hypothetical protein
MPGTIVLAGALAQKPCLGGHAWFILQYLLGFKQLGWRVLFLDQLEHSICQGANGKGCTVDESLNLRYFLKVMKEFGLDREFSLICDRGQKFMGLSRHHVTAITRNAALFINIMGYLTEPDILGSAACRVFLDIDPGFSQMWHALGQADVFQGHDAFVTIGENIGRPECSIPCCGLPWVTTRQPIALDCWPAVEDGGERITSVATWRGAYNPVEYGGKIYGQRVHEFRKFASLPHLSDARFELALDIHPADHEDRKLLEVNGWSLQNPSLVAGDPWSYQDYIQRSRAEFVVAKNMYVETRSGWFSDRSICYLASGKPVLAQDTGLRDFYLAGEGLIPFRTLEEAQAGVEKLRHDYARHARAARRLAQEHFDSDRVLGSLLGRLGVA